MRYAVAESATDAAERGQRVLVHFAEPRGGKACEAGLTYLAYVSISLSEEQDKKSQSERFYRTKSNKFTNK